MEESAENVLIHLKRNILIKKIYMNFILDRYSLTNTLFKYFSWLLLILTPLLSLIGEINPNFISSINKIVLIISTISAGILKIKSQMNIDQIREVSKTQSIKYESLYQKIINESLKPKSKRQNIEDFIYWITREFNSIELLDPDISHSVKNKFVKYCIKLNIKYDEDVNLLINLDANYATNLNEDNVNDTNIIDEVDNNVNDTNIIDEVDNNVNDTNIIDEVDANVNDTNVNDNLSDIEYTRSSLNSPNYSPTTNKKYINPTPRKNQILEIKMNKEKIKNFNNKVDLDFALNRLNNIV